MPFALLGHPHRQRTFCATKAYWWRYAKTPHGVQMMGTASSKRFTSIALRCIQNVHLKSLCKTHQVFMVLALFRTITSTLLVLVLFCTSARTTPFPFSYATHSANALRRADPASHPFGALWHISFCSRQTSVTCDLLFETEENVLTKFDGLLSIQGDSSEAELPPSTA